MARVKSIWFGIRPLPRQYQQQPRHRILHHPLRLPISMLRIQTRSLSNKYNWLRDTPNRYRN